MAWYSNRWFRTIAAASALSGNVPATQAQTPPTARKKILIPSNASETERAALAYAIRYNLPRDHAEADWVRKNLPKYKELLGIRDELCAINGLDPDKYMVRIDLADENAQATAVSTSMGSDLHGLVKIRQEGVDTVSSPLGNLADLQKTMMRNMIVYSLPMLNYPRRVIYGVTTHEFGHTLGRPGAKSLAETLKDAIANTPIHGRYVSDVMAEMNGKLSRTEESRADAKAVEVAGCDAGPIIDALTVFSEELVTREDGTKVKAKYIPELPHHSHSNMGSRVKWLKESRAKLEQQCRERQ